MKKLGFLFALVAFFGFATLTSCNQPAAEGDATEEVAPVEEAVVEEAVVEEAVVEEVAE